MKDSNLLDLRHTPVIFVHGLTNVAGDYHQAFDEFMSRGYLQDEIYATTYGPIGHPVNYSSTLKCQYAKQVIKRLEL